ncbi:MAG TPA: hypothetical protein VMU39_08970 [Solirubrobacteraceae bacterium]|nr:hypothetical protein [Solirubrobacteraceae bacterium]
MTHCLLRRLSLGLAIAAVAAAPAQAKKAPSAQATTTPVDTSMCTAPALTQPFLFWQDTNWYALAPGQTANSFTGTGWVLSGGAKIVTMKLADSTTGSVLDLPAGSQAVSPTVCLTSAYPNARMMVSNLSGSNGGKVGFSVSYAGTSSATSPVQTGTFKTTGNQGVSGGWELSDPVALAPSSSAGWQPMQITLTASGPKELAVYNLYLDPRMSK